MKHNHANRYLAWLATAILSLSLVPALCAAGTIYNTSHVLEHSENECIGVPNCVSLKASRLEIEPGNAKVIAVNCPEWYPYIWNWDAEQHEHILVKLIARTDSGLTLSASNLADAPGNLTAYVGCSSEPFEFNDLKFPRI